MDWYLKWISSAFILGAMSIRDPELQSVDLILSIIVSLVGKFYCMER